MKYSSLLGNFSEGDFVIENVTYEKNSGKITVVAPVGLTGSDITVSISSFAGKKTVYDAVNDKYNEVDGFWSAPAINPGNVKPGMVALLNNGQPIKLSFAKTVQNGSQVQ